MARHIAKNVVANGYADKCEIQISYAIGVAKPVSVLCETFGTSKIDEQELIEKINDTLDELVQSFQTIIDNKEYFYEDTDELDYVIETVIAFKSKVGFI